MSVYLDAAFQISAGLARDAVWDGARCNWFGPVFEDFTGSQQLGCGTLGPTLYDGTAGVALFLAAFHRLSGDPLARRTAAGAIEHALDRADDIPFALHRGFYTGFLGIGFAAIEGGAAIDRADLVARGRALVRHALDLPLEGRIGVDIMSGDAGAIALLLRLAKDDPDLLDAAQACGSRLLESAERSPRGLSWDALGEMADLLALDLPPRHANLTGLSHGAGGIGWALLELGAATGDARFQQAARDAFAYEDSWFDAQRDQWPDLRNADPHGPASAAWCHGAMGIGLARMRAYELTGEATHLAAAHHALRITARSVLAHLGRGTANFSLCHGVAGDAELFLRWWALTGDAQARSLVDEIARYGLARYPVDGPSWPSGTPGAGPAPSLMLGAAGTGYFYLRAHDARRTPSVLLVTPEVASTQMARAA